MRRTSSIETLLALVLGALLAVVLTWPLATGLGTALPFAKGFVSPAGSDTHIWVWDFWWVKEALASGVSPFHSDAIFPPRGSGLGMHTHAILYGLLAAPLTALFGAPFAVGAALLGLFATAFGATWLLARGIGASRPAAFLAGFGWAFSPYFQQKALEHMNLMASAWPPLLCLFLLGWMTNGSRKAALGAGLTLGLAALSGPLVLVQSLLFGLFFCAFAPGERVHRKRLLEPRAFSCAAGLAALVASPALLAIWRELASAESYSKRFGELGLARGDVSSLVGREVLTQPRLIDFIRLPDLHPLGGGAFEGMPGGNEIAALHVSGVLLVLAGAALFWSAKRGLLAWAGLGFFCFLLAWDPSLPLGIGRPSGLYRRLPLMDGLRVPARFWPYALLPLVLLAAHGVDALGAKLGRVSRKLTFGLVYSILVFESWPSSFPMIELEPPPAIVALASEDAVEGQRPVVLTLPAQFGASEAMTWQTQSGRTVVASYLARLDPWVIRRLEQATPDLYKVLVPASLADGRLDVPAPASLALDLEHLGVGVVLVDQDAFLKAQPLFGILAELLDDMPDWTRRPDLGQHARWYRN